MKRWKEKAKHSQQAPPGQPQPPVADRYYTSDATTEALAGILKDNERGLLLSRDELSGWLDGFGRYAKGGDANADATRFIEMYHGDGLSVDRKFNGFTHIPHANLSITGTVQPAILRRCLSETNRENGLAARILMSMPPPIKQRWRPNDDVPDSVVDSYSTVVERLYSLQPGRDADTGEIYPIKRQLPDGAMQIWGEFFNEHNELLEKTTGDLAKAFSKLEVTALRFALIFSCITWACDGDRPGDDAIAADAMQFGCDKARWFRTETARVYSILSESGPERRHRELVELIQANGGAMTRRELMLVRPKDFADADSAKDALDGLVDAGLAVYRPITSVKGGRPKDNYELITKQNP